MQFSITENTYAVSKTFVLISENLENWIIMEKLDCFATGRPTEIPEDDVFICESTYDESKHLMKKLIQDGLKKFNHTSAVTEDEIYFFRRPINPAKVKLKKNY